ncbi:MAG: type II toxin-antitoxin system VapC family toxin [Acidobacteria bacterium]|nr:type II toxin-antitoxin system VapC family toxin [Acidobacteriota bacterium]
MAVLVDTSVLVRLADPADSRNGVARRFVRQLQEGGSRPLVAVQNLIELWTVMTRPRSRNGLGLDPDRAQVILRRFELAFPRLPETPAVYSRWRDLVVRFGVSGVRSHDARLVALMLDLGIRRTLTFDGEDFRRFESAGIEVICPS